MARVASYSDKGTYATRNQDALCVKVASTELGEACMAVVCDGVGGLSLGEVASASVARLFGDWFERDLGSWLEGHRLVGGEMGLLGLKGVWGRLLRRANAELGTYGRAHGGALGTTFTGVFCLNGQYLVAHVGDCRAYLAGEESTTRLTRDQTAATREVVLGRMSEDEAARSRLRSVLLQSVGTQPSLSPAFRLGAYDEGDLFVLASDGAWRLQTDAGIDRRFRPLRSATERELAVQCESLCAYDTTHGERDNLTVVCLGPESGETWTSEPTASLCETGRE